MYMRMFVKVFRVLSSCRITHTPFALCVADTYRTTYSNKHKGIFLLVHIGSSTGNGPIEHVGFVSVLAIVVGGFSFVSTASVETGQRAVAIMVSLHGACIVGAVLSLSVR